MHLEDTKVNTDYGELKEPNKFQGKHLVLKKSESLFPRYFIKKYFHSQPTQFKINLKKGELWANGESILSIIEPCNQQFFESKSQLDRYEQEKNNIYMTPHSIQNFNAGLNLAFDHEQQSYFKNEEGTFILLLNPILIAFKYNDNVVIKFNEENDNWDFESPLHQ